MSKKRRVTHDAASLANNTVEAYERLLLEKQQLEADLIANQQALDEALQSNMQSIDAAFVGQITSGLRHELGNALTVIRLNLSLLEHYRADDAKFTRHMNSLKEGVYGVERVLHATRYFPAPELDTTPLIDLSDILRESLNYVQQEVQQAVPINFLLPSETLWTRGIAHHLAYAFTAILENAFEASLENQEIRPPAITISVQHSRTLEGAWEIEIQDSGVGLTPEALQRAAEPGFTTRSRTKGDFHRLGMGLFVASTVFNRHDGGLRLSNAESGGGIAQVWLPHIYPRESMS